MNATSFIIIPWVSEAPLIFFSIFLSVIRSGNFCHSLVLFCNVFILPLSQLECPSFWLLYFLVLKFPFDSLLYFLFLF